MNTTVKYSKSLIERAEAVKLDPKQYKGIPEYALESWVAAEERALAAEVKVAEAEAKVAETKPASKTTKALRLSASRTEDFVTLVIDQPAITSAELAQLGFSGWSASTARATVAVLYNEGLLNEALNARYQVM